MFDDRVTLYFPMEAVEEQLSTGGFVEGGAQLRGGSEAQFRAHFERFKDEYAGYSQ